MTTSVVMITISISSRPVSVNANEHVSAVLLHAFYRRVAATDDVAGVAGIAEREKVKEEIN